jgi:hypothetical protein
LPFKYKSIKNYVIQFNILRKIMTEENQVAAPVSDKELNFRALENKYRRELENERTARMEAD